MADLVQFGMIGRVLTLLAPGQQDGICPSQPIRRANLIQPGSGAQFVVAMLAAQELVDLDMDCGRIARKGDAQTGLQPVHHAVPVPHQLVIMARHPRHTAREILGIQHVAEPQQLAIAGCHQVTLFQ